MIAILTSHPIQYQAPLWRALAQESSLNFEVWFLTPHAVAPSRDREFGTTFAWDVNLLEGYRHRFVPVDPGWRLARFNGIKLTIDWKTLFREHGVTAIWIEGWRFRVLWEAVRAARALGIPVWLRGETPDLIPQRGVKPWFRAIALRWFFSRVHRFLYIGTANRRFYRQFGVAEDRLRSAPYCVDNDRFASVAAALRPSRSDIRSHWQIDANERCVLFCAKMIEKKRPFDLLAAAQRVAEVDGQRLHLLWVGDGRLLPPLREAAGSLRGVRSTFAGFLNQSDIPRAFVAADCLVLPSDYGETWGLVVNEALACGVPTIASDRCGCAEDLALPQGPAHVFPCGNAEALSRSLRTVLHAPPSPARLAEIVVKHHPGRTVETIVAIASEP